MQADFHDGGVLVPAVWLFASFFVTIVPIFHGGDRSLDRKYLGRLPDSRGARIAFIWDDYMLLLTAVLFVCIAEAIPSDGKVLPFFGWMAWMFLFDVVVLTIDWLKTPRRGTALKPYPWWILANAILCGISTIINCALPSADGAAMTLRIDGWTGPALATNTVCILFLVATCVRTILDYAVGGDFMGLGDR